MPLRLIPRSQSSCAIHSICEQYAMATIYLALVVEKATEFCFLECHEIKDDPMN